MADLMAYPIHINAMNRILFRQRSRAQTKLLARALKSLEFYQDECVAGMTLSQYDFQKCGALPEHSDAVVNFGIDTIGIQVAFLARETAEGDVKISFRALPPADVSAVAKAFGGGGHALAAGCTFSGTLPKAVEAVLKEIEKHLAEL
jgi:Exopolyphosphatase-related proteins